MQKGKLQITSADTLAQAQSNEQYQHNQRSLLGMVSIAQQYSEEGSEQNIGKTQSG